MGRGDAGPAEVPQWEDGSLGDFFIAEPAITGAAAAPPAAEAVLPTPERMLALGSAREAVASLLIRAVVFDGCLRRPRDRRDPGPRSTPVIEWEAGHSGCRSVMPRPRRS